MSFGRDNHYALLKCISITKLWQLFQKLEVQMIEVIMSTNDRRFVEVNYAIT